MAIFSIMFFSKFLPLIYALIGFGLLITVHECGHFLFCKLFKIHTPTFSIGRGPTVFKRKIGQTNFRLGLIPVGGYVEIADVVERGSGGFRSKPYWQRALVIVGGVLFNFLFAYAVFCGLYITGMPVAKEATIMVNKVSGSVKGEGGFVVGDKVMKINGHNARVAPDALGGLLKDVLGKASGQSGKETEFTVDRSGQTLMINVPVRSGEDRLVKKLFGDIGVDLQTTRVEYEKFSFFAAVKKGIGMAHNWVGKVLGSLWSMISSCSVKGLGGPIMLVSQGVKMAQRGFSWFLVLLAIFSINLAVIQLLPLGALDGGQLLLETVEAISRKRIPNMIRAGINLTSGALVIFLMMFLSYQDVMRLIFGG